MTIETVNLRRLVPRTEMRPPMTMDTAVERTGPIGTLILINHYLPTVCTRCDGSGVNDYRNPNDLCGACEGAGMTRQDGELL